MSVFKHWLRFVGKPAIEGIIFGFIIANLIFFPLHLFTGIPYLPLSILIGNFGGAGIICGIFTFLFFRYELPKIREIEARENGFITKEM